MEEIKIGEYRLIPKGIKVWSIKNQTNIMTDEDEIVEVKHTCVGSDTVFVQPKQLIIGGIPGLIGGIPGLMGRGTDEWVLSYSKTLPYSIPKPNF